jgi:hypothetical protein
MHCKVNVRNICRAAGTAASFAASATGSDTLIATGHTIACADFTDNVAGRNCAAWGCATSLRCLDARITARLPFRANATVDTNVLIAKVPSRQLQVLMHCRRVDCTPSSCTGLCTAHVSICFTLSADLAMLTESTREIGTKIDVCQLLCRQTSQIFDHIAALALRIE